MKNKKSFSMVELMVVIAVIGILAAVAVPSYKTYIIKSKVMNAFSIINKFQKQAEAYYNESGTWPSGIDLGYATQGLAEFLNPSSYVPNAVGVYIDGNTTRVHMTVHYDRNLGTSENFAISFYGKANNGAFTWICGIHPWPDFAGDGTIQYMPSNCQQRNPNW